MARPIQNPRRFASAIRCALILVVLSCVSVTSSAGTSDSTEAGPPPRHRHFVDSCLRDLAGCVLSGFTPNRTLPIVVVSDTATDSTGVLEEVLSRLLSDRGLLIRDESPDHADAGNWSLHYALAPVELSLAEPQRRVFLGKIWLKRTLHAGLRVLIHDDVAGEDIWNGSADTTYFDWVPKRDLKMLEEEGFSPQAPSTGWEKAKTPLIVGAAAVVAGSVFLTLR